MPRCASPRSSWARFGSSPPFCVQISNEKVIDLDTFNQILDLDEDDTHDFSLGMTQAYFSQAATTFVEMDKAFDRKDLTKLSSLGHFLKGSSAALGVSAVQATCEHIQHYGALRDEENGTDLTEEDALAKIGPLLKRVKREYEVAEKWLTDWYKQNATPAEA
ncbi:histidine phosphotransferase [Trametes punicea]|nr:histidine phosphotransferase [Trametes punicea]